MKSINLIYLRVSKEDEKEQDPEQQLKAIIDKYELKEYDLYQERGSAWDLTKVKKREKFLDILDICFKASKTTVKDLYLGNIERKEVNLYVWDYARIMRNIELNLLFSMLSYWFNVKIHSWKDRSVFKEEDSETPTRRMARIMMNTISAFSSEEYSYTISTNTKKSFKKVSGVTVSTDGNKCGKRYKNSKGERVVLSINRVVSLRKYVISEIINYETHKKKYYYKELIDKVNSKFDILLSKAQLTKLKKEALKC